LTEFAALLWSPTHDWRNIRPKYEAREKKMPIAAHTPNYHTAEERLRVFRNAAALLASSLEFEETLAHVIAACLPALGDFGFFDVVTEEGVRRTSAAFEDAETEAILRPTQWVRQKHSDMNLCALSTGCRALHAQIDDAWYRQAAVNEQHLALLRKLAFHSMITVPMRYRGELLGALTLFMGKSQRRFSEADIDFAGELVLLAAPVVVNVRLLEKQRRAEAALRASEERLRLATDASGIGIWDWDVQHNQVTWTDRVYELHGLEPGSFGGRVEDFMALVHPEDSPKVQRRIDEALHGSDKYAAEFRILRPDGSIRWLVTHGHLHRNSQGKVVRMVGATIDVTDHVELLAAERAAKAEAQSASRAKDEFLAILGHELRNPLAPIVTALQLMELRGDVTTRYEQAVIARQVDHLSCLVDDLLDISRISQGKVQLKLERIDVRAAIEKAIELASPLLEKHALAFDVALPPEPVHVLGDAVRLSQVFGNLLSNAAKFTPEQGHVRLEAKVEGNEIAITVRDTGIGIAPELLPHVFDLFVQGPQRIDRQAGGLGLGLTIAKTLLSLHGGHISVQSAGPGTGSCFEVRLPLTVQATLPLEPSETPPVPASHARILIVDDNVDAGETIAALLSASGCEVQFAPDGETALRLAPRFMPEVAIIDIGLPDMDGHELARRLKAAPHLRHMRLIALSGYGYRPANTRNPSDFDRRLVKPVRSKELFAAIGELTVTNTL